MRKMLSFILPFLLIIAIVPLDVAAEENNDSARDRIFLMAEQVFPEYKDVIRNGAKTEAMREMYNGKIEPVYSETRKVSEHNELTFVQFSDGNIMLISSDASATVDNTYVENGTSGIVTTVCTITVVCSNSDGEFELTNFTYRINPSALDSIVRSGSYTTNSHCRVSSSRLNQNETSSKVASAYYYLIFDAAGTNGENGRVYQVDFTIEVGNNRMTTTVERR